HLRLRGQPFAKPHDQLAVAATHIEQIVKLERAQSLQDGSPAMKHPRVVATEVGTRLPKLVVECLVDRGSGLVHEGVAAGPRARGPDLAVSCVSYHARSGLPTRLSPRTAQSRGFSPLRGPRAASMRAP